MGDGDAVVCDGDTAGHSSLNPGFHLPLVEHTAAAVDHQGVLGDILRKFTAGGEAELQLFSGVVPNPGRQLLRADIPALAVVGTSCLA